MENIESEIEKILTRNKRVEKDKAWETSMARRIFITIITFVAAFLFLKIIKVENAWLAAIIPSGGFFLSTLQANPIQKIWEKFQK